MDELLEHIIFTDFPWLRKRSKQFAPFGEDDVRDAICEGDEAADRHFRIMQAAEAKEPRHRRVRTFVGPLGMST
jgi:hypothetical protein